MRMLATSSTPLNTLLAPSKKAGVSPQVLAPRANKVSIRFDGSSSAVTEDTVQRVFQRLIAPHWLDIHISTRQDRLEAFNHFHQQLRAQGQTFDLRGINLKNKFLRGIDLRGANLTGANLKGANLKESDLTGTNLSKADLTRAVLTGATLVNANLANAVLTYADLTKADITGADFTQSPPKSLLKLITRIL